MRLLICFLMGLLICGCASRKERAFAKKFDATLIEMRAVKEVERKKMAMQERWTGKEELQAASDKWTELLEKIGSTNEM